MPDSHYLSDEGLETFDERNRFEEGLRTKKPRKEQLWNEDHSRMVYVKSLGHVSPQQFKEQFEPMNSNWENVEKDTFLHKNVDYKMDDLVKSVKQRGIVRPVIVGNPIVFPGSEDKKPHKPEVLDGLHRAIAASRAGIDIPVNVLDERHQQPMRGATYNLSTEHEYNPAFAKPKSRRRR